MYIRNKFEQVFGKSQDIRNWLGPKTTELQQM